MAGPHHRHSLSSSSSSSSSFSPSLLDALFCEEDEQWEDDDDEEQNQRSPLLPILLLEHDLFWEDEELLSLLSKEEQICFTEKNQSSSSSSSFLSMARRDAVEWMLTVNSYYGFSTLTAILAVNYLDRFFAKSLHLQQQEKPWIFQLAAVACLSLAAKVEETHVPLLLDLQVDGTKYAFEAKTIQKMELLVLSTLNWRMNPVTPISFLDHIIRRLGLKTHLHWEFLRRCERLLLAIITDSRVVSYLPSVLATATMLHVIDQIQPSNPLDYHNQLLSVLDVSKEEVKQCYELILQEAPNSPLSPLSADNKRKREELGLEAPRSPNGVIDAYYFSSDGSSTLTGGRSSTSSSVSSSPAKKRVREQYMPLRVIVDAVGSPQF